MTKYLKIPADLDQPMEVVDLKGLDQLREGIGGGWLEGVNLPPSAHCPGARLYCDEEYQFKQELGVNYRASVMAQAAGIFPRPDMIIGGDVLLFDLSRGENDAPISHDTVMWAKKIENIVKKAGLQ